MPHIELLSQDEDLDQIYREEPIEVPGSQQRTAESAKNQASQQRTAEEAAKQEKFKKTANKFAFQVAFYRELKRRRDDHSIPIEREFSLDKPFTVGINGKGCKVFFTDVYPKFELISFDDVSLKALKDCISANAPAYDHFRRTNNTINDNRGDLVAIITVDDKNQIDALTKIIPESIKIAKILLREGDKLTPIPVEEYVKAKPKAESRAAAALAPT